MGRKIVFFIAFLSHLFAATFHSFGIFIELNEQSVSRHFIYAVLNFICLYGIVKRPTYFFVFYFFLMLNQIYNHGGKLINHWQITNEIKGVDLYITILLPSVFLLLLLDYCKLNRE